MFYTKKLQYEMEDLKKANESLLAIKNSYSDQVGDLVKEVRELRDVKKTIREEFKKKEEHAVALMKIEQEKEIHRQVSKVKEEFNNKEKQLLESNFDKLGKSLEDLHQKGNSNTKFIEKTSLKMMEVVANLAGRSIDGGQAPSQALLPQPIEGPEYLVDEETGREYYIEDGEEYWKE